MNIDVTGIKVSTVQFEGNAQTVTRLFLGVEATATAQNGTVVKFEGDLNNGESDLIRSALNSAARRLWNGLEADIKGESDEAAQS